MAWLDFLKNGNELSELLIEGNNPYGAQLLKQADVDQMRDHIQPDERVLGYVLGRVVLAGRGLWLLAERINGSIKRAIDYGTTHDNAQLIAHADDLEQALQRIGRATKMAWSTGIPGEALANAVPYMQAFGHTVLAWIWLEVEMASQAQEAAHVGRRAASHFFFNYELPKIGAWLKVVESRDMTCAQTPEDAF